MSEITITQLRKILGLSYPTALKLATANGVKRDDGWHVPAAFVRGILDEKRAALDQAFETLNAMS